MGVKISWNSCMTYRDKNADGSSALAGLEFGHPVGWNAVDSVCGNHASDLRPFWLFGSGRSDDGARDRDQPLRVEQA